MLRCANRTAPVLPMLRKGHHHVKDDGGAVAPLLEGGGLVVLSQVTPHVASFGKFTAVVNALWARRFGHGFLLDGRPRAELPLHSSSAKVAAPLAFFVCALAPTFALRCPPWWRR